MRFHQNHKGLLVPDREIVPPGVCDILQVTQHIGFGSGQSNPSLFDVLTALGLTTDLEFCLDGGDLASYPVAGTTWLDRTTNGFDFFRGATSGSSTDDPTHNGTPGGLSISEYFSFDGGDHFEYDSGGSETAFENCHKNNALFSWMHLFFIPSAGIAATLRGFSTGDATQGIRTGINGNEKQIITIEGASITLVADTAITPLGAWNFCAGSIDEATGAGGGFLYLNGAFDQISSSDTFDATYTTPSASNSGWAAIGALGDPAINQSVANTRIAMAALWEGSVRTKADFDAIFAQVRGRFGI